ncbi:MAG: amino acid permease [Kofleriaceae bacterium]
MAELKRSLGIAPAISTVVGIIVGTGIFLKTAVMARTGGSATWVLLAWIAAGGLSMIGAFVTAELGSRWPRAGGEYVFQREGYGDLFGFLYAWNRFWISAPGAIAAYAVAITTFIQPVIAFDGLTAKLVRLGLIVTLTAINCLQIVVGGAVQTVLTAAKILMIVALTIGVFAFSHGDASRITASAGSPGISAFAAMVLAALWAYDGSHALPSIAGELKDPERTLPRATLLGMTTVIVLYLAINAAYFYALPFGDVAGAKSVGQAAAATFLGTSSQVVLAVMITVSAFASMNASVMVNSRVAFAASADGLGPKPLAHVSPKTHVPIYALLVQMVVASIYAWVGQFDELTDAVVVVSWVFYGLNAFTVVRLRKSHPPTSFATPGWPVLPMLLVVLAVLLVINSIWTAPRVAALGGIVSAVAVITYLTVFRRRASSAAHP